MNKRKLIDQTIGWTFYILLITLIITQQYNIKTITKNHEEYAKNCKPTTNWTEWENENITTKPKITGLPTWE